MGDKQANWFQFQQQAGTETLSQTPAVAFSVAVCAVSLAVAGCASRSAQGGGPAAGRAVVASISSPASPTTPGPSTNAPPAPAPSPAASEPAHAVLPELEGEGWQALFDGASLDGWKITDFGGHGEVTVENGQLILGMGAMLTGVNLTRTNALPKCDYELAVDAMRVMGSDFFCALTFVVGDSCCSLVVGGWGGGVVGISSIDSNDASSNETTRFMSFEDKKWYRLRVRVTKAKLEAWVGREQVANVTLEGKRISVRPGEIELNQPFGLATYQTTGAIRSAQWRALK